MATHDLSVEIWREDELAKWGVPSNSKTLSDADHFSLDAVNNLYAATVSTNTNPYNVTPLTGRTGVFSVPPNSYPFYSEAEKYMPKMQPDGGQLSEWSTMYNPSKEEAEVDRADAVTIGIPHGFIPKGAAGSSRISSTAEPMMHLTVVSEIHEDDEYGSEVDLATKRHTGGPFVILVPASIRVADLRLVIRDKGGVIPAICRLSYAGKHFEDGNRTIAHYGVGFWAQRFPHWPLKIIGI